VAHTDYNNDATVVGTSMWSNPGVGGTGYAFRFTGTNHLNVPIDTDEFDFDFGNYVTVSAWVRPSVSTDDNRGIVMIDEYSSTWKILMYMSKNFISFGVRHPDNSYSRANYSFADGLYVGNGWHHIVGTYNRFGADGNGVISLYVDGEEVVQLETSSLPIARGEDQLVIGKFSTSAKFIGSIDEVTVLNHAWTAGDVADHYAEILGFSAARDVDDKVSTMTEEDAGGCNASGTRTASGLLLFAGLLLGLRRLFEDCSERGATLTSTGRRRRRWCGR
jgi:hypothetical protein